MKQQLLNNAGKIAASTTIAPPLRIRAEKGRAALFWSLVLTLCVLGNLSVWAQSFRSQFTQVRATVPVGFTNVTVLGGPTNTVILTDGATNANFDVSGLPAGAAAVFVDAYGNSLPSTTQSTNLQII